MKSSELITKNNYMNPEHVAYFDKLIQQKLESLPRAVEGIAPIERLEKNMRRTKNLERC